MAHGALTRDVTTRTVGDMQIRMGHSQAFIDTDTPVFGPLDSLGAMASTKLTGTREVFRFMSGTPAVLDGVAPLTESAILELAFYEKSPKMFALAVGLNPLGDMAAMVMPGLGGFTVSGTTSAGPIAADNDGSVDDMWMVVFDSDTTGNIYGVKTGLVHTFASLFSSMAPDNPGPASPYFTIPASFFTGTWAAGETYTFKTTAFVSGTTAYANNYQGEVPLGRGASSDFFRIEAVLEFPLKTTQMVIIFPKAQVVSAIDVDAQAGGETSTPLTFEAGQATSISAGGHAIWDDAPLGKVRWIS